MRHINICAKNQPSALSHSSAISLSYFSYFCYFWPKGKKLGQNFWVKILPLPRWISMEKIRYLAPFIWLWEPYVTFCDGQTDRQTDRQTSSVYNRIYIYIYWGFINTKYEILWNVVQNRKATKTTRIDLTFRVLGYTSSEVHTKKN